jgi:hypothetical protein
MPLTLKLLCLSQLLLTNGLEQILKVLVRKRTLFEAAIKLPKFQYLPSSIASTAAILDAACDGLLGGFLVSASK